MSESDELTTLLQKAEINLVLVVSDNEIRLDSKQAKNRIYLLEVDTGGHSAGGRGGGFGQRTFRKIYGFDILDGTCRKFLETAENIEAVDAGTVVRKPITLPNGKEIMVSCSIDSHLVSEYNKLFGK